MNISDILNNKSFSVREKTANVALYLHKQTDKGVAETIDFILKSDDPIACNYLVNYLSILPNFNDEKQNIVRHILDKKIDHLIAIVNLVKFMPPDIIEQLIKICLADNKPANSDNILFEIAIFFPTQLQSYSSHILDENIKNATLTGGKDEWVDNYVASYRKDKNPDDLFALSRFHTNKAISALIELNPIIPEEDKGELYMYIENSGVFPDTRKASRYFQNYRGFIVDREESPHHMGKGFNQPVPKCPICNTPATRILTLDTSKLAPEYESEINPSFFWYQCNHTPEYVIVQFVNGDIKGLMTPMTEGPDDSSLLMGNFSLLLEKQVKGFGYGLNAVPGYSNHHVGGFPPWVNLAGFPRCPICQNGMKFMISIDSGNTPFGRLPFDGILYGFWCEDCHVSLTTTQDMY